MKRVLIRRITLERFKRALEPRSNRRLYCFAWGRFIVMWEGKKRIPDEFVDAAGLFDEREWLGREPLTELSDDQVFYKADD